MKDFYFKLNIFMAIMGIIGCVAFYYVRGIPHGHWEPGPYNPVMVRE